MDYGEFHYFLLSYLIGHYKGYNVISGIKRITWDLNRGLTSNKPTHYVLDYGEFHYFLLSYLIGHYKGYNVISGS